MWIGAADAIDLFSLTWAELLVRIEAPRAVEQALVTEHFVNAGNAAGEIIRGVEDGGVGVGEFGIEAKHAHGNRGIGARKLAAACVDFDGAACPQCPLT